MVKVNDIYTLKCESINNYGKGVSRIDSLLVFIDDFYPGEIGEILITSVKKNYCFGKVSHLTKKSEHRIDNVCKHEVINSSCPFSNIDYEYELELKKQIVLSNINFKLNTNIKDIDITSGDLIKGYRNKVTVFFNKDYEFGTYAEGTNDLIVIKDCVQIKDEFIDIINKFLSLIKEYKLEIMDSINKTGYIKGIVLRKSEYNNDIILMIITKHNYDEFKVISEELMLFNSNIKGVSIILKNNYDSFIYSGKFINIIGNSFIVEKLGTKLFKIDNMSFLQVNTSCASKLYKRAIEIASLNKDDSVLDLYCGCGGISLNVADYVNKVIGIEEVESSIDSAKENSKINNINNAIFYKDDSKNFLKYIKDINIDCVFVDPPREGLSKETIDSILESNINKIIYISCDPYTLSNNLKMLNIKYEIKHIECFNMFSRTHHVETVVALSLKK